MALHELRGRIRPHHPPARREMERLEHHRIREVLRDRAWIVGDAMSGERRHRHARCGQTLPLHVFVPRRACRRNGDVRHPERFSGDRRGHHRLIVDAEHGIDPIVRRKRVHHRADMLGRPEIDGDQPVGSTRREGGIFLGGDHEIDTQPSGRLDERFGAVGGGGEQEKKTVTHGD